jgi:hypothetical protein
MQISETVPTGRAFTLVVSGPELQLIHRALYLDNIKASSHADDAENFALYKVLYEFKEAAGIDDAEGF